MKDRQFQLDDAGAYQVSARPTNDASFFTDFCAHVRDRVFRGAEVLASPLRFVVVLDDDDAPLAVESAAGPPIAAGQEGRWQRWEGRYDEASAIRGGVFDPAATTRAPVDATACAAAASRTRGAGFGH